jgi:hypothetical protein
VYRIWQTSLLRRRGIVCLIGQWQRPPLEKEFAIQVVAMRTQRKKALESPTLFKLRGKPVREGTGTKAVDAGEETGCGCGDNFTRGIVA